MPHMSKVFVPLVIMSMMPMPNRFTGVQAGTEIPIGVGFVKPRFHDLETLRFYGPPPFDQLADMVPVVDSISFTRSANQFDIATAPPWLVPEVLKLDYDLFYFRAVTLAQNWVEVVVNQSMGRTAWVDRQAVEFVPWPDFLLSVFAVEVIDPLANPLRLKPLEDASPLARTSLPLRPLAVHGNWLYVAADLDGGPGSRGWVRWRDGDRLLISFSLLS